MAEIWGYKIFDYDDGVIKFIFHGVNNSRVVPIEQWVKAEIKEVRDSAGPTYQSGFHIFTSWEDVQKWPGDMNGRVVIRVKARGIRQKPTKTRVLLADELYVANYWGLADGA